MSPKPEGSVLVNLKSGCLVHLGAVSLFTALHIGRLAHHHSASLFVAVIQFN
jgi:hypothetical protein